MLTALKVSFLVCKRVFYKPEHDGQGGPNRIEFGRSLNAEVKYTNR